LILLSCVFTEMVNCLNTIILKSFLIIVFTSILHLFYRTIIWDEVPAMVEITIFWFQIHITNGLNSLHRKWHTGNQYMVKSAENRMRSNLEGCRMFRNLVVSYLVWDEVPTMVEITIFWFQIHITNGLNSLHRKWHTGNQYMVKSAENRMRSNLEGCRTFRNLVVSYLPRDITYRGKNV
jgi:hypothetical protein